jgi:hypothetical protein
MEPKSFKRSRPRRTADASKLSKSMSPPVPATIEIGTVGYTDDNTDLPETTPAYVRFEQGEPIVEITVRGEDRITARVGVPSCSIRFGQQIVIAMPDGDPANAIIIGVLADTIFPVPSSVCGIDTGASGATDKGTRLAAATWHFAIQTQAGGDVLIHAGASIHLRCNPSSGAVHVEGAVHLGVAPLVAPTGSEVGPGGVDIPGVPAVAYVPTPYTPAGPAAPVPVPYVGLEDGIVRAKDAYQITPETDPDFFAWMTVVNGLAMNPDPAPLCVTARISGENGAGSKHTAVGEPEPD